jgi:hypothetical protein
LALQRGSSRSTGKPSCPRIPLDPEGSRASAIASVAPGAGPTLPSRPPPEAQLAAREEAEGGGGRRRALLEEGEEGCRGGEREELPPEEGDEGCRDCTCSRRRQRPPRAVSALPSPDAVAREAGRGSLSAGRSRGQDTPLPPASRRLCRWWRPSEGAGSATRADAMSAVSRRPAAAMSSVLPSRPTEPRREAAMEDGRASTPSRTPHRHGSSAPVEKGWGRRATAGWAGRARRDGRGERWRGECRRDGRGRRRRRVDQ